jgi:anti-sigma-K factor RskA
MEKDLKVFLESGLLERYMMGTCSREQKEEVEYFIENFPEVKAEYDRLQEEINNVSDQFTDESPDGLKEAIISCLEDDTDYQVKNVYSKKRSVGFQFMPWAAALIAFIGSVALFTQKNNLCKTNMEIHAQLNMVAHQLEATKSELAFLHEKLAISGHDKTERLVLTGNELSPNFSSTAFWNEVAGKAILYVNDLGELEKNQCYQVWADVDGKMVNVGIIPLKKGPIEIDFLRNATSLNITIEPKGGSEHPSVENLISSHQLIKI